MNRSDVENVLLKMGVPSGIKGFKYITDAIELIDKHGNMSMTKELYPKIALINNTTAGKVEMAIRHAFEIVRSPKGNYEEVAHYIGFMNCGNGNSLSMMYMKIKQDCNMIEKKVNLNGSGQLTETKIRQIVREELKTIMGGIE